MIFITLAVVIIAIMGAPLFAVMAMIAILNFTQSGASMVIVPQEFTKLATTPLLHSIPLFTFAGYLLAHSKASQRLVRMTKAALGWVPGGLAIVTIIVCSIFTAFTGASGVTIVALGGLLLPALMSEKYKENYSLGLVTASGSFGLLFPPSLPIIMFGVVAGVSIDKLFIAGIAPGVLMTAILSLHAVFIGLKYKIERTRFDIKELGKALWEAKWELPLPILLFSGIYSGKLAISDAAAFTVVYVFIVEVILTRDIKLKEVPKIMQESMVLVGALLIIMGISYATTNYIIDAQIPQKLFEFIRGFIDNKWVFLILLNIFLLIVGCVMDIFSAIIVIVPLILPIAAAYNINIIHLGIIFLANLQIGYITPPVGMNLFISSIRFKTPVVTIYKASFTFILLLLASLAVITYAPGLSTWFLPQPSIVGKWQYQDSMGDIDIISLKAAGKYLRVKGSFMDIMTAEPYRGDYEIDNGTLKLKTDQGIEEYRYEIYNEGKRLLLEMTGIDRIEEYSEENADTSSPEKIDRTEKYYKNTISRPLTAAEGRFVSKWKSKDNTIEFYYNDLSVWKIFDQEKVFRYKVIGPFRIAFTEYHEDLVSKEKPRQLIFDYKFFGPEKLRLRNKTNTYIYDFTDSDLAN